MKNCKTKNKMNLGGTLSMLSPLLNLIPGGQVAAPLVNTMGQLMSSQNKNMPQLPVQQNSNPYRLADGGKVPFQLTDLPAKYRANNAESKALIQKQLISQGFNLPISGVDGILGKETGEAVKRFQKAHGLKVDGILGPQTLKKLEEVSAKSSPTQSNSITPQKTSLKTTPPPNTSKKALTTLSSPKPSNTPTQGKYPAQAYLNPSTEESIIETLARYTLKPKKPLERGNRMVEEATGLYGLLRTPNNLKNLIHNPSLKQLATTIVDASAVLAHVPITRNYPIAPGLPPASTPRIVPSGLLGEGAKRIGSPLPSKFALGGYLSSAGPKTQEVFGNNPEVRDGVDIGVAAVDHGETISDTNQGQYVFSDRLINPQTGNTFAQDDKKLAKSDKASMQKPYDKEAQNTLRINQMARDTLAKMNDKIRAMADQYNMSLPISKYGRGSVQSSSKTNSSDKLYEKENGGPIYQTGYRAPWTDFDIQDFQKFAKIDVDNIYGPKTHEALMGDYGKNYARSKGYYQSPTGNYLRGVPNLTSLSIPYSPSGNGLATNPMTAPKVTVPQVNPIVPGVDTREEDDTAWQTPSWLGTGLQLAGLATKGLTTLRKPEKQNLYLNNAPITRQNYDPANALLQSQYNFGALRQGINNSVGEATKMSNLLQGVANKTRQDASIIDRYDQMNMDAKRDYEARLAQRNAENNQYRYNVDTINDQNRAARNNSRMGFLTDLINLGGEINNQSTNKQNVQWLLSAYPDIASYISTNPPRKRKK